MLRKLVLPALALCTLPGFANAQFEAGDWELSLTGSAAASKDTKTQNVGVSAEVGYFYTKELEVGFRQQIQYVRNEEDDVAVFGGGTIVSESSDGWGGQSLLFLDYHFDFGRWQPFVGVFGGYTYSDATTSVSAFDPVTGFVIPLGTVDDDSWVVGPEVGVKYFVNGTTFIFARGAYTFWLDDNELDNWNIGLGIGVRL
jgi:hypothetical protein